MQPVSSLSYRIGQGVLLTLLAIWSASSAGSARAADLCDLKFQTTARGEWAIQRKTNEHFVFRTQRKLLEPPAIHGISTYYDVAEDAAMDALQSFTTQNYSESEKKGSLIVSRSKAQRMRCGENNWTFFIFDLAKVRLESSESQPMSPVQQPSPLFLAPPKPNNDPPNGPLTPGLTPGGSQPNKTTSRTLTTIEE